MLAHNLDYATIILDPADLLRLHPDDYEAIHCPRPTPEDPNAEMVYYYVKRHVRQGQCPLLLANLLAERGAVKQEMKKHESTSEEYGILNSRSTALKLSANSTYGYVLVCESILTLILSLLTTCFFCPLISLGFAQALCFICRLSPSVCVPWVARHYNRPLRLLKGTLPKPMATRTMRKSFTVIR
jgi:DNA polymerase elongation subunit (family B)